MNPFGSKWRPHRWLLSPVRKAFGSPTRFFVRVGAVTAGVITILGAGSLQVAHADGRLSGSETAEALDRTVAADASEDATGRRTGTGGGVSSSHEIRTIGGSLTPTGQDRISLGLPVAGSGVSSAVGPTSGWLSIWSRPHLNTATTEIEFVDTQIGEEATFEVEIINGGRMSLLLQEVRLEGEATSPLVWEPGEGDGEWTGSDLLLPPGGRQLVVIRFQPEAEVLTEGQLRATTNDLSAPVWTVPIQGRGVTNCIAALEVAEEEIDFGNIILRASDEQTLVIENVGCGALTIEAELEGDAAFSLTSPSLEIPEQKSATLEVLFQAAAIENIHRATLRLTTNDPDRGQIEIPLTARSVLPAQVAVLTPPDLSLDFLAIMDEPDPEPFLIDIQNSGGTQLRWSAETVPAVSWIELSPTGGTLAPAEQATVTVRLNTTVLENAGRYDTSVRLFNDDRPDQDEHFLEVGAEYVPFVLGDSEAPDVIDFGDPVEVDLPTWTGAEPDSVVLVYAEGGSGFDSAHRTRMENADEGVSALIPADFARLSGVDWFIEAYSGGYVARQPDVPTQAPNRLRVLIGESQALSPTFLAGDHAMLSLPLSSSGSLVELLGDDLPKSSSEWRVGRYDAAVDRVVEYPELSGEGLGEGGNAYWFIAGEDVTFDAFGVSSVPNDGDNFVLPLAAGQSDFIAGSQVGTPFPYPVLWSDCRVRIPDGTELSPTEAADAGWIDSGLYDWRRQGEEIRYVLADRLEPWRGYFVGNRSEQVLELLIPARRAPSPAPRELGSDPIQPELARSSTDLSPTWSARVSVLPAGLATQPLELGLADDAALGWDARDHVAPAPPIESKVRLGALGHAAIGSRLPLSSEFRPVTSELERWPFVVEFREMREIRLRIETSDPGPDRATYLLDHETGAMTRVDGDSEVRVLPESSGALARLEIVHGPKDLLDADGIRSSTPVTSFALDQVQPSPFRTGTAIRFRLEEAGWVNVSVFDAGGRLVRRLVEEDRSAGPHIVRWDGRRDDGDDAPAGVYLLQLSQGDESLSRRLVRVK